MPIYLHLFSINIDTHGHSVAVKKCSACRFRVADCAGLPTKSKNAGGDSCERLGET